MSKFLKMKNQMIFSVNSYGARNNNTEWGNLDTKRQILPICSYLAVVLALKL